MSFPENSNLETVSLYAFSGNYAVNGSDLFGKFKTCTKLTNLSYYATNKLSSFGGLSELGDAAKSIKTFDMGWWSGNRFSIKTLDGFENLINLETLNLRTFNSLDDINALSELKKITSLCITDCRLKDISSVKNLDSLIYINVSDNLITDISSLENLTNLQTLYLNNNSINDIYPLKNLKKLETLSLQNNALTDMSSHNGAGYETLDIFYDLNYEKGGALKNLYIAGNNIDDTEILLDLNWSDKNGF